MGCASSSAKEDAPADQGAEVKQTTDATPAPVSPPAQDAAPQPQPLYVGPSEGSKSAASPGKQRTGPKRERSNLNNRGQPREDDEESDWDQCSTSNFNMDEEQAESKKDCDPPANASIVEKAAHNSLYADQNFNCRETTTLRVDKVKGCMFVNQYLVVKFLGRGACGKVFLCLNTHDMRLYAMKAVRKVDLESAQSASSSAKKRNPMDDLKREIMIMKNMKHNNIVVLSEVIDDPAGSKLLLVMEFMEGGPVLTREALEKREKLPESLALQYFRDMLKALDYLHGNKVVHGDLKPENVLMGAAGDVKLSDFGCSKVFATGNEYLERCNGTPAFLAPEMMKPNTRYRGRPTDVYALGACLYTLIFGRIPFSAPNLYKLFQVVQNEPVKYPEDVIISDNLRDLVGKMLIKNPRERITLQEMMRHPWVTMDGRFVLKSSRELKAGESQEMHSGMAEAQTFALNNPRADYLHNMASLSRHERTFNEGDVIMRQGDTGTYLLYIVSGTVDVLVRWAVPPKRTPSQSNGHPGTPPPAAGSPAANRSTSKTQDEFMDESDSMSPITDDESRAHRVKLERSALKASEFVRSLQGAAARPPANGGPATPGRELLVAQRGPGELVGEMALFSKSLARCATVRCASRVVARIITHEQLVEYVMQQPLAKHQIREVIWKKESEITMVEALVKLANAHEIIAASLEARTAPNGAAAGGPAASPPTPGR